MTNNRKFVMSKRFPKPRKWVPSNPKKYIGNLASLTTRSSYETKFFDWCDRSASVVKWNSEEVVIPYICPSDGLMHRYFVDALIQVKNSKDELKTYLVEIKPDVQTRAPVQGKKKQKTYLTEVLTWAKNEAKWKAARSFCAKNGIEFLIITEHDLKI